jgi:hypothetical protein
MQVIVLVIAVIAVAGVATTFVTGNLVIAWLSVGASFVGFVLLVVDAQQERERRAAKSASAAEVLPFDTGYPDYAAIGRRAPGALVSDHEIERALGREQYVLRSDNGPRGFDVSRILATEFIHHPRVPHPPPLRRPRQTALLGTRLPARLHGSRRWARFL